MKNLQCLVIDDERHAAELLSAHVLKTPGITLGGLYTSPLKAIELLNSGGPFPDITFLDINMPELSGMDLAGLITSQTTVVFTTSFREYAPEAFDKEAADYLLKPISYERFLRCIQKIRSRYAEITHPNTKYFFLKTDTKGKIIKVDIAEIRYIESAGNYVQIYLAKERIMAYLTLGEILEQLPAGDFSRIHKSCIVAHAHIRSVEHFQVRLQDREAPLPVGHAYSEAFQRRIQADLLVSKRG